MYTSVSSGFCKVFFVLFGTWYLWTKYRDRHHNYHRGDYGTAFKVRSVIYFIYLIYMISFIFYL
jgi:hypothetical protein